MFRTKTEPKQKGDNPSRKSKKQEHHTAETIGKTNRKTWPFKGSGCVFFLNTQQM